MRTTAKASASAGGVHGAPDWRTFRRVDVTPEELRDWEAEFDAAARRPLRTRMRYAFIKTYKPILDDAPYRSFDTTAQYRAWCEANLPGWLGYGRTI